MLLALDIGNTNITGGLFDGEAVVAEFRLRADATRPADEYAAQIAGLLHLQAGSVFAEVEAVALASVAPALTGLLTEVTRRYIRREPFVVRAGETDTGLTLAYDPPDALGADRLVNAFAAHQMYAARQGENRAAACIVVDYGTATKLEAVSGDGVYLGGVILPGAGISMDALFAHAALLRRVELTPPPAAIGANTADALRSGILYGYAAQTDGLVYRFRREMNVSDARVVATGGLAPLIAPHAATVEIVDTRLTLTGLRLLYERAQPPAAKEGQ
jgi:type III pantothenate kinase